MIKKIILIGLFCLFLVRPAPIFAQQTGNQPSTQQTQPKEDSELNFIQQFLKAVADFFGYLIFGTNYISKIYEPPATYNTDDIVNDYTSEYNDYSSRAMPEPVRMRRKGVYFYEVMFTNKYQDLKIKGIQTPGNNKANCPHDISISDIVCFYSQKYQAGQLSDKILYTRQSDIPIDYPNLSCGQLNNPDICYLNAYQNYQDIPQGDFYGEKGNSAAVASTQLNESIRTLIPENRQGESAPPNNDTRIKVKALVEDSDKQEESMLLGLIPDEIHDNIGCDNNANIKRDNLRQTFKCNLTPYGEGDENCGLNGDPIDASQFMCNKDLWAPNGPGISQRGAHGMALVGFNYMEIIHAYYGIGVTTILQKGVDDQTIKVVMIDDTNNDANCSSLVNSGLASAYDKANLESGTGGVYYDGLPCEYIDITPPPDNITDPDAPPPPPKQKKYQVKVRSDVKKGDQCFGLVTLKIHEYLWGIAEMSVNWHIEAQKAIMIAARGEVLQAGEFIVNGSDAQVFQCRRVIQNSKNHSTNPLKPKVTNQRAAVDLTRDEVLAYTNTNKRISNSTHRSAFCGPGSSNPSFNGWRYETISYIFNSGTTENGQSINGICFEGVSYRLDNNPGTNPDDPTTVKGTISDNSIENQSISQTPSFRSKTVTASLNGNLYYFNDTTRQSPIKENYDLINVDNAKWLTSFQNQTNCQLDSRVFPALTSLIEKLNQDIPNISLIPKNCYRSFETQSELWTQGLAKYKDTYTNLIWHSYPGTSIHQTGRVIDFYDQTGRLNPSSPAYKWLLQNGSAYGFYHYKLEPWHWEYNP